MLSCAVFSRGDSNGLQEIGKREAGTNGPAVYFIRRGAVRSNCLFCGMPVAYRSKIRIYRLISTEVAESHVEMERKLLSLLVYWPTFTVFGST